MARLAGVDIPRDKRVEVALTYIYGVGRTRALKTLADTEISGEIRVKDLTTCTSCSHVSNCTRCPGLAYMEGNMRGPSSQDCEKSFARTGVPSANMLAKKRQAANLVQIRAIPTSAGASVTGAIA